MTNPDALAAEAERLVREARVRPLPDGEGFVLPSGMIYGPTKEEAANSYLRGWQDALATLVGKGALATRASPEAAVVDAARETWAAELLVKMNGWRSDLNAFLDPDDRQYSDGADDAIGMLAALATAPRPDGESGAPDGHPRATHDSEETTHGTD